MSLSAIRAKLAEVLSMVDAMEAQPVAAAPAPPPTTPTHPLQNASAFYDHLRATKVLGATLEADEVSGCEEILKACVGWPLSWTAYALATPVIETKGTMQPVREAFWLSESARKAWALKMYDIQGARPAKARELGNLTPGDGYKYDGKGYVQITGKANYAKAEAALGVPLVTQPELALTQAVAARIMRWGMETGAFTGKSLRDYLPAVATVAQFTNARRVINGTDRAEEIAAIAMIFQDALTKGGWKA